MNFLELYIDAFKHFLDWKGKSTRRAFWAFCLMSMLVSFLILFFSAGLANLYCLVALIPGIMLCIRRARDTGYSPFLALIALIPLIGVIILGILPSK